MRGTGQLVCGRGSDIREGPARAQFPVGVVIGTGSQPTINVEVALDLMSVLWG